MRSGARLEDAASSAASSASDLQKMDATESSSEDDDAKRERQTLKIYLDYVWQHFFTRYGPVRACVLETLPLLLYFENEPIDQDVRKTAEVCSSFLFQKQCCLNLSYFHQFRASSTITRRPTGSTSDRSTPPSTSARRFA